MKQISKALFLSLVTSACLTAGSMVMAQDNETAIEDINIEMEGMPPQPAQTTTPEESLSAAEKAALAEKKATPAGSPPVSTTAPAAVAQPNDPLTPSPVAENPATNGNAVIDPLQMETSVPHSGLYYDSEALGTSSSIGAAAGPREVDPKYEPGSRFVVAKKGAGPETIPARIVAAQRALSLGRYTSALELYEQLYRQVPRNRQVLMGLAVAQQNSGYKESAIATYEELLKVDPKNTDAMVNMIGLMGSNNPAQAYSKLESLWNKNTQNPGLAAQMGILQAEMGNKQEAFSFLGIAATLEPNNASHVYNMAVISDQAGEYQEAISLYEKALELDVSYGGSRSIPRDTIYNRLSDLRRL